MPFTRLSRIAALRVAPPLRDVLAGEIHDRVDAVEGREIENARRWGPGDVGSNSGGPALDAVDGDALPSKFRRERGTEKARGTGDGDSLESCRRGIGRDHGPNLTRPDGAESAVVEAAAVHQAPGELYRDDGRRVVAREHAAANQLESGRERIGDLGPVRTR